MENIPTRVFPPGELSAYSNYGAGLAAYIVERVSGMPFHTYVEENIFAPLGMQKSTFRQPLPPELAADLSEGYLYSRGAFEEGIFEFIQPYPAGALSSTATDMARFMIAHLQNGRYGDARILQAETAHQMHELAFAHDPRLSGWGAGFTVSHTDGVRRIGHGGDTVYFHSELLLLPDENVGLFVSTNTDRGTMARFQLMQAFVERYFTGLERQQPESVAGVLQRADEYEGTYFPARRSFTGIGKLLALLQPVQVRATAEGSLAVTGLFSPEPTEWVETSPHLFAPVSSNMPGSTILLFAEDDEHPGEIERLYFEQSAYIKQPAHAAQGFHFALAGMSLLVFLVTLVTVPAGSVIRRRSDRSASQTRAAHPPAARAARWGAWLFALLNLIFIVGFFIVVSDINNVIFGLPPFLQALLVVPWISVALALSIVMLTLLTWVKRYWTAWGRLLYSLFALVALGYLWFLWFWNLL